MYYTIGEISSMVSISKDTLRYYDEIGVLKPCKVDSENGYRYYDNEQISILTKILEYKDYGFTLEQIKTLLVCNDANTLRVALQNQCACIAEQINKLMKISARIKKKLEVNDMDKKKVLIVDDAEFMRQVLTDIFNNHDAYEPVSTASGEEALSLYSLEKPWLVLMDIAMPGGMNGIECTAKIRALDPEARIVMLSAHNDAKNREDAKVAGACGFISKPFKGDDLLDFISNSFISPKWLFTTT